MPFVFNEDNTIQYSTFMQKTYLSLLLCLFGAFLFAQDLPDQEYFEALAPRNIGPAGMSGRVTAIDVDLSNPEIIYVGTASGGVWKSTDGGIKWRPIFEDQPLQAIGSIKVNQTNTDEIWVGTGEGNPRNSHNTGQGLYRSRDAGDTWELVGLENTRNIHRIIVHRDNPDVVYVGAMGSIWGPNEERGVFRTTDGGDSWEHVLKIADGVGIADLVVDPTNPDKLLAAMWEFDRDPWYFNSGGPQSGLYVTYDGGDNWTKRTAEDGLPKGDLGRIGLAIAPSEPNIIYALVEAKINGLYKSTDGGKKWKLVSEKNIGNRPFYYAELYVDPVNENRIYNLYTYVSLSEDGGKTFKVILDYGTNVHPDHHAFWVHPNDPNYLIEGNDGGLNISRDRGKTWRFVTNIPAAQFYHINHDMDIPYNVGGGMQDNGSWVGPSQALKRGGITNHDWQEIYFGDGFDVLFKPDNNRYTYAMSQGGNVGLVDRETGASDFIKPIHPDGERLRFNWNAAMAQDPREACTIYFGSQFVHKSTDCGQNWTIISPDLTTNDTTKQKADISGGLTFDATQAENYTTILAIAPSHFDENTIWASTDDGNLQLTRDGGQNWENLASRLPGAPAGSWIPYLEASKVNEGELFVIVNDYRRNNFEPMAYHTNNYGKSWTRIVDEDDTSGFTLSIVQDPEAPNHLWLGTDHGLYFSIDYGGNWSKWTAGFPSVPVADMKIHPRENDLIIGTFGRAAWILDDIRPMRALAANPELLQENAFAAFPSPDAYLFNRRSYQGIRFYADGEFVGKDRPGGALLSVWVQPEEKESEEGKEEAAAKEKPARKKGNGKVKVQVVDSAGDTIRTFSAKVKPGFNRFTWNLRQDGVAFPSRRERRPDANPPRGGQVAPGTYTLVMTYGEEVVTTSVNVMADPRVTYAPDAWEQRAAVTEEIESIIQAATDGFQRLQDMRATTDRIEKAFVNAPESTQERLKKQSKDLKSSIAEVENLFMEPTDVKGIKRDPTTLMNSLFAMSRYSRNLNGAPSQMLTLAIEQARTRTTEVLAKVNALIAGEYADYQQDVEAVSFSLFEPIGAVRTFEASSMFPEFEDEPDQLAMLETAAASFTYDGKEGLEAIKEAYTQAGKNGAAFLENLDYALDHFPQHPAIQFTADEDDDGEVEVITASGITLAEVEEGTGELETFLANGSPIGSPYDGYQLVSNGSEMGYRVSDYSATVSGIDFNYFVSSVADNFAASDSYAHESFYYYQEEEWGELESLFTEKELNGGWPPARGGFNQESITFTVGDRFDRYQQKIYEHTSVNGTEVPDMGGTFTSPIIEEAYAYEARALKPAEAENALYYVIEILEPLEFGGTKADVIPWFGKPGLATQVEFDIPTDPETGRAVTWTKLAEEGKIRIRIVSSPDGSEKPYVGIVIPGR